MDLYNHQHHHHHGGGHSVVKIVKGKSPYRRFVEFLSRSKRNLLIICIAICLSVGAGFLVAINLPDGFLKMPFKQKTVVREINSPQDKQNTLRNDKKAGKAEISKLKNEQNKWLK
jgi:hypothetical protein